MRNNYATLKKFIAFGIVLTVKSSSLFSQATTQTFSFTGSVQSFTVPFCVSSITLDVKGSQGGTNAHGTEAGGLGGEAYGILPVSAGDVLNLYVGGTNGYNGGGNPGTSPCTLAIGGSGGGASDIRLNGTGLSNRVIAAGGGGGGGGDRINNCGRGTGGGGGGGYYGGGGGCGYPQNSTVVATGGTQYSGGQGGASTFSTTQNGANGTLGAGGNGGVETSAVQTGSDASSPGGPGGGLVGGNGQQPPNNLYTGQSGAGGSSYLGSALTATSTTSGVRAGNGIITISYDINGGAVSVSPNSSTICTGSSITLTATSGLPNYTWAPSGTFAGSNSQAITQTPTITTVFTVQSTSSLGCVSYTTVAVTVNTTPSVSLATSAGSICTGETVSINASGVNSYTFSNGIGNGAAFTPSATNTYTVSGTNACGTATAFTTITVTPLQVSASASNTLVCPGTTINLSATGANTYTWTSVAGSATGSNCVATPVSNTTYSLLGATGACSGFTTITVNTKLSPTLSISASNSVICYGGFSNLVVNGNALSYTWSPGNQNSTSVLVNPPATTSFSVSGTNSVNCVSTASQIIAVTPNPTIIATPSSYLVCAYANVTLTATGAASYTWTNGPSSGTTTVNPPSTTTYSVSGSYSTGCSSTATVEVGVLTPDLSVSGSTSVCNGSTITIHAGGAINYLWSTGSSGAAISVSPSLTTVYTVTGSITDLTIPMTCTASKSIQVTVNDNPTITVAADHSVICAGTSALLTAGGASTYTWIGPGAVLTATNSVSPLADQTYSVTGTDINGCLGNGFVAVQVSTCDGINSISPDAGVLIYPNPASNEFTITANQKITLQLTNELGQLVKTIVLDDRAREARISNLTGGVYFVTGSTANGSMKEKIIIAK